MQEPLTMKECGDLASSMWAELLALEERLNVLYHTTGRIFEENDSFGALRIEKKKLRRVIGGTEKRKVTAPLDLRLVDWIPSSVWGDREEFFQARLALLKRADRLYDRAMELYRQREQLERELDDVDRELGEFPVDFKGSEDLTRLRALLQQRTEITAKLDDLAKDKIQVDVKLMK